MIGRISADTYVWRHARALCKVQGDALQSRTCKEHDGLVHDLGELAIQVIERGQQAAFHVYVAYHGRLEEC